MLKVLIIKTNVPKFLIFLPLTCHLIWLSRRSNGLFGQRLLFPACLFRSASYHVSRIQRSCGGAAKKAAPICDSQFLSEGQISSRGKFRPKLCSHGRIQRKVSLFLFNSMLCQISNPFLSLPTRTKEWPFSLGSADIDSWIPTLPKDEFPVFHLKFTACFIIYGTFVFTITYSSIFSFFTLTYTSYIMSFPSSYTSTLFSCLQ